MQTEASGVPVNGDLRVPPREHPVWSTTLYQQYWQQKDLVDSETLLFFRLGDFYELFGRDALIAAPVMEVQLTSRDRKADYPIPMCGVPAHHWTSYAEKLLNKGYKIALCEQLSDPSESKSKIVERGIVRILTPGLPVDFKHIPQKKQHYLLSLNETPQDTVELVIIDFLSAKIYLSQANNKSSLKDFLKFYQPAEILIPQSAEVENIAWGVLNDFKEFFVSSYGSGTCLENLKAYLRYTQRWSEEDLVLFWRTPILLDESLSLNSGEANISSEVLEQWNVFPDLFDFFDRCGSVMGSRKLRELLSKPLTSVRRLRVRQNLLRSIENPHSILKKTTFILDVERLLGRFRVRAAQSRELLRFTQSLISIKEVIKNENSRSDLWNTFLADEKLPSLTDSFLALEKVLPRLESVLSLEVDTTRIEGLRDLIRCGCDPEFDKLYSVFSSSQEWLIQYEEKLKVESGISKLKVRYNKVFGYFVEVSKSHVNRVPNYFERKQTTVNAERYVTPELQSKEEEILSAEVKIEKRAKVLLDELQTLVLENDQALRDLFETIAWMDAYAGILQGVKASERFGSWVFPEIQDGAFFIDIKEARHPLVEWNQGSFVANSIMLGGSKQARLLLLTGPNMAGKSTLMRQTGLCLLLAQCGIPVPCQSMCFAPAHAFFSRMGASDKILQGESTFMVEMKEASQILSKSNQNSFILIDEIGRGTSTLDGLAIAQAILEELHDKSKSIVVFASHYHELSKIAESLSNAQNASMEIKEWNGDLIFLRSLINIPASNSYGIHVAKMAGLPASVLARAQELFATLCEKPDQSLSTTPKFLKENNLVDSRLDVQMSLFSSPKSSFKEDCFRFDSIEELLELDLNDMSPRSAWEFLAKIKKEIESKN